MSQREKPDVKMSRQQRDLLIAFMESHPDFQQGKFLGAEGRKKRQVLWTNLAQQLNQCDGAVKTATKWQMVWFDLKHKTKRKVGAIKKQRQGTGGGGGRKSKPA